jgi:hypothetical protein
MAHLICGIFRKKKLNSFRLNSINEKLKEVSSHETLAAYPNILRIVHL